METKGEGHGDTRRGKVTWGHKDRDGDMGHKEGVGDIKTQGKGKGHGGTKRGKVTWDTRRGWGMGTQDKEAQRDNKLSFSTL